MTSAVAELETILQSMLNLKPPGVSGSKISAITSLANANVQSESVLIQKIYTHFKKTPGTHKLGVLYVVDSVTRQWVDQAKKSGQNLDGAAPDGTFAAGVNRVTELLPALMNDIINSAPEDQKAKIKKLIEIWERSSTFPAQLLSSLKEKLDAPRQNDSTTPTGSPGPGFIPLGQQVASPSTAATAPPPQQDTAAILAAIKNMANQSASAQTTTPTPQVTANLASLVQDSRVNPAPTNNGQAVNSLGAIFAGMSNPAQAQAQAAASIPASNPIAAFLAQQQPHAPATPQNPNLAVGTDVQAQIQLIQLLAAQGVPSDQWGTALQLLNMQNQNAGGSVPAGGLPFPMPNQTASWPGQNDMSRDRDGYPRSPPNQYRRRSRSPDYDRRRDPSPRRGRNSPGYDTAGRRGNDYRVRSPRRRRSPSPPRGDPSLPPPGPKNIQWDKTLPPGCIRVLSRTLFVGGVTSSEQHLRALFATFGVVQTCIVNTDKRHAFVKMINRVDAERARTGMEEYRDGNTQLRTKWGVGFGPRDCSDYPTGISVIPVDRLTDADRKWLLTAEYGGTGGLAIEAGMVVEEPDIEIGAGVSSKAMSKRIPTDKGGQRGPQSSRIGGGRERYRDDDRRNDNQPGANGSANMAFPMGFPSMPGGMPMLPGFQFPFNPQQQNGQR